MSAGWPATVSDLADWSSPEAMRWGLGTRLLQIPTGKMRAIMGQYAGLQRGGTPLYLQTHPIHDHNLVNWEKWRLTYEAGDRFIEEFVLKFSNREDPRDYARRKQITPVAAFASAAIDEIKNSIFQRIGDTTRTNGPDSYQQSITGRNGGVDLHGSSINWFMGHHIIPELLVQKKVGIYVDAPNFGVTQADKGKKHPYFIAYRAEDIRNWAYTGSNEGAQFSALLLREFRYVISPQTGLPLREVPIYRHVFLNPQGFVTIQFFDQSGSPTSAQTTLGIKKIPFAVGELTNSLMKNVANHQISLTNMESSDIAYILKGNYALYTEQFDQKNNNPLVRQAQAIYQEYYHGVPPIDTNEHHHAPRPATVAGVTGMPVGSPVVTPASVGPGILPGPVGENFDAGPSGGRRYPIGAERPGFISPSPDPIKVSMEKGQRLKDDIRSLVHLALASVQSRGTSAESKLVDREQGLESGLAAIGLELEHLECQVAAYWAMYEGAEPATVIYPKHWSLKSVEEVIKEVESWEALRDSIPSNTFKSEVNKIIVEQVIGTKVSPDILTKIKAEIDKAKGGSSDPKTVNMDVESGVLSAKTASGLRGYPDGEVDAAQNEHSARLASIAEAQSSGKALNAVAQTVAENELKNNPAARGVPDLSPNPAQDAKAEKLGKDGRGEGK